MPLNTPINMYPKGKKLINLHKKDRFKINGYNPNMLIEDKLSIFLMDTNNFFRETHNFITDCKKYMKEIE